MSAWKMTAADFYDLLKQQDHKCCLSGKILTPQNVRIAKISPEAKHSKTNVCLVHEILAPLTVRWSITDVRITCIQIAHYIQGKASIEAKAPKISSKSKWQLTLDRVANFNKSMKARKTKRQTKIRTWGESVSNQVSLINRQG